MLCIYAKGQFVNKDLIVFDKFKADYALKPVAEVQFSIPGRPVGKQRPKQGKGRTYKPKKTRMYERKVACVGNNHRPRGWPTDVKYGLHVKPVYPDWRHADVTNVEKIIEDGLEGVLWDNDKSVIRGSKQIIITSHLKPHVAVKAVAFKRIKVE